MIDGPDVEFLLREKDFMIKAIENDLRKDYFLFQPFSMDMYPFRRYVIIKEALDRVLSVMYKLLK